jgi:hypothetical protein
MVLKDESYQLGGISIAFLSPGILRLTAPALTKREVRRETTH